MRPTSVAPPGAFIDQEPLERARVNFTWILKLRWAAAAGQLATIALVGSVFAVDLPLAGLLAVLCFEVVSNIVLAVWLRAQLAIDARDGGAATRIQRVLGTVMLLDIVLLTALLFQTGGPANPFVVFYIVNLVLSAVVLPPSQAWALLALVLSGYAFLHAWHRPLHDLYATGRGPGSPTLTLQQKGVPIAFGAAVLVIATFVTRVTSELARVGSMLRQARQRRDRSERMEALGTLAAGAAHELASPLSTIAVVAKDLEIALRYGQRDGEAEEDARLIRREVERCRAILDQMSLDAGQSAGEAVVEFTLAALVEDALAGMHRREQVKVQLPAGAEVRLHAPRRALSLVVRQLVKNALDATAGCAPVHLELRLESRLLCVEVRDQGEGMSAETLERAADPFFTTKQPGQGMGLGLFLAHSVVDRLEGSMRLESNPGRGTLVRVELPKDKVVALAAPELAEKRT